MNLSNKKILFIGPVFHDYHSAIIKKLEELDAEVSFYPERKYNVTFKLFNTFCKSLLTRYQQKHYSEIIDKVKNSEFDYLLVIRGYMMPVSFLEKIKMLFPKMKTMTEHFLGLFRQL